MVERGREAPFEFCLTAGRYRLDRLPEEGKVIVFIFSHATAYRWPTIVGRNIQNGEHENILDVYLAIGGGGGGLVSDER